MERLPIDDCLPELLAALRAAGCAVLKAPPGAGKTTRAAPALVDAGLAGDGVTVLLQPRRVAARAAATRIAAERGVALGDEVGYQVRFERRASRRTRLLVATTGVYLRMLADDPFLESVAAVVFDEFHERSLDADLALAMTRRVRHEVRSDLKLLVMSATLDPASIAHYLNNAPTVESQGRTYPVTVEYRPPAARQGVCETVADAVADLLANGSGDVLAFLPGVGEIQRTARLLEPVARAAAVDVFPLYGDLPLDEQQRVLTPSPRRKLVLATNVAETSITVPGVTAVVDSGWVRQLRLDAKRGLDRLDLVRISRASAEQRAGRAGRTQPGHCVRLWSQREQAALAEFDLAEIERVDLSGAVLQLLAWGETNLEQFPWFAPPPPQALTQARDLLCRLGALGDTGLTDLGRQMARLPVAPRVARLLVEGVRHAQVERAALVAALLSERDPFDRRGRTVSHHSDCDLLDRVEAIEQAGANHRPQADPRGVQTVERAARQLERLARQIAPPEVLAPLPADEATRRMLLAAFADRVCRRREPAARRGVMLGGRGVRLADSSAVVEGELFVAVALGEIGQAESVVRLASRIERDWLPASSLSTRVDVGFDRTRQRVAAVRRVLYDDLLLDEVPTALPAGTDTGAVLATAVADLLDFDELADEACRRFVARVQSLRLWMPELELPDVGPAAWRELLPQLCAGRTSVDELRRAPLLPLLQGLLSYPQRAALDREAPERMAVPSGRAIDLAYEPGKPPVLAVRIQEIFGWPATPRVAAGRIAVLLHLLAPNYRVQQITDDLASFWSGAYLQVRKDLRRRYPKHAWPENPLTAQAVRKG